MVLDILCEGVICVRVSEGCSVRYVTCIPASENCTCCGSGYVVYMNWCVGKIGFKMQNLFVSVRNLRRIEC